MNFIGLPTASAALAFGRMAEKYDSLFTNSVIGRLQRQIVWDALTGTFSPGQTILELNCGTGEDALFLSRLGVNVVACDASEKMVQLAKRRRAQEFPNAQIHFRVLPNEALHVFGSTQVFDGVLSNFSGLNCVPELRRVAGALGRLLKPGGRALLCMSTRLCLWEMLWYLGQANLRKAFRRLPGKTVARLQGIDVKVFYPFAFQIRQAFAPWFRLRRTRAVGLFIPPSYLESWATRHKNATAILVFLDRALRNVALLRQLGDHVLFDFERVGS
jgi:ubiquinone/menaquinone biosynthesis C-methylase UbiE